MLNVKVQTQQDPRLIFYTGVNYVKRLNHSADLAKECCSVARPPPTVSGLTRQHYTYQMRILWPRCCSRMSLTHCLRSSHLSQSLSEVEDAPSCALVSVASLRLRAFSGLVFSFSCSITTFGPRKLKAAFFKSLRTRYSCSLLNSAKVVLGSNSHLSCLKL